MIRDFIEALILGLAFAFICGTWWLMGALYGYEAGLGAVR